MFTGGMDAVTTFIRHADEKPLLILEYGFYQEALVGQGEYYKDAKSDRNFISDRNAATEFAQEHGTNTAFIRANYGTFVNSRAIDKRFAAKWAMIFGMDCITPWQFLGLLLQLPI